MLCGVNGGAREDGLYGIVFKPSTVIAKARPFLIHFSINCTLYYWEFVSCLTIIALTRELNHSQRLSKDKISEM